MFARAIALVLLCAFTGLFAGAARADDRVSCPQGATVVGHFLRNDSAFPVRVTAIPAGGDNYVMTQTSPLPAGAICAAAGAVTFLADASTDKGKTFHRVMSRTLAQRDGSSWVVDVAPDTFNGNFTYSAHFAVTVKAAN